MDQFLQHLNDFFCTRSGKARLCSIIPFITFLWSCLPFAPNLFHFYGFQRFSVGRKKKKKPNHNQSNTPNPMDGSYLTDTTVGDNVFSSLMFVLAAWKAWFLSWKRRKIDLGEEKELEFLLPSPVLLIGFRTTGIQPFSSHTEDSVTVRNGGSGWPGTRGACCAALTTWVIKCCRRRQLGLLWLHLGSLFLINK